MRPSTSIKRLTEGIKNFLTVPKRGFPKFKKKGKKDSFYLEGSIKILKGNYIKLPRIGIVKTYCILPSVPVKNVRISKRAGDWYISFTYDYQPNPTTKKRDVIGVDVGINSLATCSDGTTYPNLKAYKQAKKRLTRYQHRVIKKEPGSKNRAKAIKKLARLHKKADATPRRRTAQGNAHQAVADIRVDTLHQLTTWASFEPQHHSNRSMTM
ncbi:RNA-guided endonuclease InsQ/TnpB family protein [Dapis sp. BLCC M172]|uniref:RNA-guided endonuclease InsQ/TnpB family protein n=1 Tax=Dapis sp. BLCC M172 TaxID=2975281 RepID=UPI003CEAD39C